VHLLLYPLRRPAAAVVAVYSCAPNIGLVAAVSRLYSCVCCCLGVLLQIEELGMLISSSAASAAADPQSKGMLLINPGAARDFGPYQGH
jgi:hypothetical protein